jgi:hypothetical protein
MRAVYLATTSPFDPTFFLCFVMPPIVVDMEVLEMCCSTFCRGFFFYWSRLQTHESNRRGWPATGK